MFIEFRCENFLSFKDEAILNMTTVDTYEEHSSTHIIKNTEREGINLLKSIAIYGSNGGGKSNFMTAIRFMKSIVSKSFRDSLEPDIERDTWNFHHRPSTQTVNKPSTFEISFLEDKKIYRYGL